MQHRYRHTTAIFTVLLALGTGTLPSAHAATETTQRDAEIDQLLQLDISQLGGLDYVVTSVSKKSESVMDTAAAVYVITQEDIRRSGMTSVPELLRMVPGMSVSRINASTWAISIRGFGLQFANKLLVLIDGRSVYSPTFSGVYWDEQDLPLVDVERIEVIRGPGAALYGANAVNGVVNVISKAAKDTQGNLVALGAGTLDRGLGLVRHGGAIGTQGHYRVYAKAMQVEDDDVVGGVNRGFNWDGVRSGFRADWATDSADSFTLQGDIYKLHEDLLVDQFSYSAPYRFLANDVHEPFGGNLLGRWTHRQSADSEFQLQSYIDHSDRKETYFTVRTTTYDVELQHSYRGIRDHAIIWGGGGRYYDSSLPGNTPFIGAYPPPSDSHIVNLFAQDEITLIPNRWSLTLGTKLEHNSFTGIEIQPNARTLWKFDDRHSLWGAVSRAVRTPSYVEDDFTYTLDMIPGAPGTPFNLYGNPDLDSEIMMAYEIGYRAAIGDSVTVDMTGFYNDYEKIIGFEPNATFSEMVFQNDIWGETYGFEVAPTWRVTPNWMLKGSYSLFYMALHSNPAATGFGAVLEAPEGQAAQQQFSIISHLNLPNQFELDGALYYVDELPNYRIDAYLRADVRLGWRPTDYLELSLVGQNLFDNSHKEFQSTAPVGAQVEIPRSVFAKATWRF